MRKQQPHALPTMRRAVRLILASVLALSVTLSVWAKPPPKPKDDGFKFAVIGDHRGDNAPGDIIDGRYSKLEYDKHGKVIGFKDKGINQLAVAQLAAALKTEGVEFVVEIGDLVTKHIPEINGRTADQLLTEELDLWAKIWKKNSGNLPIYPVRGNQEWTASTSTWLAFTKGMPGIGDLPPNGPDGEVGLTYGFHYKNCLFLGIDQYVAETANSDTPVISSGAQDWLDQVLSKSNLPFKFVYGHVPAFEVWNTKKTKKFADVKSGKALGFVKDGLATPWATFTKDAIDMRDKFWNSIGLAGAEYFCGHEHIYARGTNYVNGRLVRQTVIGNGGAPTSPGYNPCDYDKGPFAESYTEINLQPLVDPPHPPLILTSPLIGAETITPRGSAPDNQIGYVVVEVQESGVVARYKYIAGSTESWTITGTSGTSH